MSTFLEKPPMAMAYEHLPLHHRDLEQNRCELLLFLYLFILLSSSYYK